jgi:DNA-binding beta-propeller fold protein YncE
MNQLLSILLSVLSACATMAATARGDGPTSSPAAPSLKLVRAIPLPQVTGGMNHLAADAKHGRFFVTATGDQAVVVVDLKAGKADKVLRLRGGARPAAAAFAPDLNQLCVSGGGVVTVYDGDSFAELGSIELGRAVDELRYEPRERRLYAGVMDPDSPAIAVIDLPARKVLGQVKLPAKPQGFEVEEGGTRVFVNTPGVRQVTVVDRRAMKVVAAWKLDDGEGNYPLALDEAGHRLFVGCRRPAVVLVLDAETGKVVARVGSGGDADDLCFDRSGKRAYVSCGDGVVTVIRQEDADHYRRLPDAQTREGARNALWVPALKQFFLAVPAEKGKGTELAVYEVPG